MACKDCLGRTPYGSLNATIVVCLGVGLFCGTGFRALDITVNGILRNLFQMTVPWLQNIQIAFLFLGIAMGLFAILLLAFGFLTTGLTREHVCSGVRCIKGGGVLAILIMLFTYLVNAGWLAMTFLCAMPIFMFVMLHSVCQQEIYRRDFWFFDNYCLNISRFGIYRNWTLGYDNVGLCDDVDLSNFCQHVYDAGPMYCFAFIGCCLIVLGLIVYLTSFGANYSRIKSSQELTDYKRAIEMEEDNSSRAQLGF